jgi:hypothetical protein
MRVSKLMDGYTVNLTDVDDPGPDGPDGPDAFTEIWTSSADDFMNPEKAFATAEDLEALMTDHNSFLGPFDAYVIEETVGRGQVPSTGAPKRFAFYGPGESPPDAGPDVVAVVENRVVRTLLSNAAPVELVVATWGPTFEALGQRTGRSFDVSEHQLKKAL